MKYKNISGTDQAVIGFGTVKAGEVIETEEKLENPNFQMVEAIAEPAKPPVQAQKVSPRESDPDDEE
jgi:hypothetical protein